MRAARRLKGRVPSARRHACSISPRCRSPTATRSSPMSTSPTISRMEDGAARARRSARSRRPAQDRLHVERLLPIAHAAHQHHRLLRSAGARHCRRAADRSSADYLSRHPGSSQDLLAIIDAILDLTTIDAGAMELTLRRRRCGEACWRTRRRASPTGSAKRDMTLAIEVAEDVVELRRRLRAGEAGAAQPPHQRDRLLRQRAPQCGWGRGATGQDMLLWVADTGRAASIPNSRNKPSTASSRSRCPAAIAGRASALPSSRASSSFMAGKVSLLSRREQGHHGDLPLPAARAEARECRGRRASHDRDGPPIAGRRGDRALARASSRWWRGPACAILLRAILARASPRSRAPSSMRWPGGDSFDVPSPTFTLVQTYDNTRIPVAHADLYRIESGERSWTSSASTISPIASRADRMAGPARPRSCGRHADGALERHGREPARAMLSGAGAGRWRFALRGDRGIPCRRRLGATRERSFLEGDASFAALRAAQRGRTPCVLMDMAARPDGPPVKRRQAL